MQLTIGNKPFDGPVLIPSISSFETQVPVLDALQLQALLQEPISLISAYDLGRNESLETAVSDYRAKGGVIFIDSGGYESSRVNKYLGTEVKNWCIENDHIWTIEKYKNNIQLVDFDLAATFDTFIENDESFDNFKSRLISFFEDHKKFLDSRMVPVVHLRSDDGSRKLDDYESISLIAAIAKKFKPDFIAIPERELGEGIIARYALAKSIVSNLRSTDRHDSSTKIHILGCGNPLTFAILAHAGIALADGLEWCRTNFGYNFHLFHFQQFDIVSAAKLVTPNAQVNTLNDLIDKKLPLALAKNLHTQQDFVERMKVALKNNNLLEFLTTHYEIQPRFRELLV